MNLQSIFADKLLTAFPDAEIKKINKDNFLDIYIPSIYHKRGSHLAINTAKNRFKFLFYCREIELVNVLTKESSSLEKTSNGVRYQGNPEYTNLEDAVEAAITFLKIIQSIIKRQNSSSMNSNKEIIKLIEPIISNFDPSPIIVNDIFPLRWESNIFIQDYDFTNNYLDLDSNFENSNGEFLKSVGSAIQVDQLEDGTYEYWDGIFMIETHTWCSKLNNKEDFPSFSLINQKFENINELKDFLIETYV